MERYLQPHGEQANWWKCLCFASDGKVRFESIVNGEFVASGKFKDPGFQPLKCLQDGRTQGHSLARIVIREDDMYTREDSTTEGAMRGLVEWSRSTGSVVSAHGFWV